MKKRTIVISCAGIIALAAGITVGVNRYQYSKNVIDVIPVEMLNSDWGMEETGSSGMVTNSMSQEIIPDDEQTVKKIYVKEGQKVKIGDKLLAYDMAKKKLDMELKEYDVKQIEFSIQRAEKELTNLKKGIVSGSSGSGSSVGRRDPLLASLFLRNQDTQAASEQETEEKTESATEEKTESTTEKKPEATTQKPSSTTEAPDEEVDAEVYSVLTSSSKPYKGKGTSSSPYRYLCTSDCKIKGSFINKIRGYNSDGSQLIDDSVVAILEVRKGNKTSGSLINSLTLYGSQESKKNPKSSWSLDSYPSGEEDDDTKASTSTSGNSGGGSSSGGSSSGGSSSGGSSSGGSSSGGSSSGGSSSGGSGGYTPSYTKDEINSMITEKENDLADLRLDLKEAQLEYETLKKEVKDGTVTAVINGVVKEVNDPEEAAGDGSAVVTVSSEGNLYVKGTVDEFSYKSVQTGTVITANSWETGNSFEAKITEISPYPASNSSYYNSGTGNPNVSYYPFTAIIENPPEDISSGESVTINFNKQQQAQTEGSIYLPLAYVRSEGGKSYVYLQGKDKKLEKRYVTTGQTLYNYVIEIKDGISVSDSVAFPYGKNLKEGAKTKTADSDADIIY